MPPQQVGVVFDSAPTDWTILQQDATGHALVTMTGRVEPLGGANANTGMVLADELPADAPGVTDLTGAVVELRVVGEATGLAVLEWVAAHTTALAWSCELLLPAGGLYRLESRLRVVDPTSAAAALAPRGDMRHFIGVGDVWAIAGQSNSSGYGRGPYEDPPELGVHLFSNANTWGLAAHPMNESTNTAHPQNREGGNPGHSPFLQFGRVLQREANYPIGLLQVSLGASALSVWEEGAALATMMSECTEASGCGGLRGICWYQGETDAGNDELTGSYLPRFNAALVSWREALRAPAGDLLCVTVQLSRVLGVTDPDQHRRWTQLREAQRQAAAADPARVAIVSTFDQSLTDGIHNSPAGNMVMGGRMALAALGLMAGSSTHRAPEAVEASLSPDGLSISVRFEHVSSQTGGLGCIDALSVPFVLEVTGSSDEIVLTGVTYPGADTITLQCGRAVTDAELSGGLVLHGAYGCDPGIVPMDMERVVPMLGFHGLHVATHGARM